MPQNHDLIPASIFIGNMHGVLRGFERQHSHMSPLYSEEEWLELLITYYNEVSEQNKQKHIKFLTEAKKVQPPSGDGVHSVPLEDGGNQSS